MAQVLIRRLNDGVVARLRARAERDGKSLEELCRVSLEDAARRGGLPEAVALWRSRWPDDGEGDADPFGVVRSEGPGRDVDLG